MKYNTIKDAASAWVREFNAIPTSVVEKLAEASNYGDIFEVTPPATYNRVYVYDSPSAEHNGEIVRAFDSETEVVYQVDLDDGITINTTYDNLFVKRDDFLPMWGTMWQFGDFIDEDWIDPDWGCGGLQLMANCGFRVYESEDFGHLFGIDGAGYDFYESHWIPLYKARGLRWHREGQNEA